MSDHEDNEQPKRSFKVDDRRRFSETGEARPGGDDERSEVPPAEVSSPPAPREEPPRRGEAPPMTLTFSTFIISLSTQALAHLGEITDPAEGRVSIDLLAAKQLIDILGILEEKSKGNLDEGEAALLEHCLYDLRLKYVEVARGQGSAATKS